MSPRIGVAMEFQDRVRTLRMANGYTQADLAEALGITQRAVGAWETGRSKPKIDRLIDLAEALHVSPHWLLDGTEPGDTPALTTEETELLQCFRATDARGKETILAIARQQRGTMGEPEAAVAGA